MKVGIEALGAHLGHLLHVVGHDVLQQLLQIAAGVDVLQLLLVQVQHLVHSPLELELRNKWLNEYLHSTCWWLGLRTGL